MAQHYAIGVDTGATKILAGLIDCDTGEVINSAKLPSPTDGPESLLPAIHDAIGRVLNEAPADKRKQIARIGIGLAGQVDKARGVLRAAPNLGGGITSELEIAEPLRARFDIPVLVGNDVEVAAIGESHFGAGKGIDLFACIFVGTGIGGALMEKGKRYRGASGSAGEIGHIMVRAGGRQCGCGQRGHLEAYASRTAIVNILREEVEGGTKSSIGPLLLDATQRVKSKQLSIAMSEGDPLVVNVMTQAGLYLSMGMASLINLWNPQRIVLGGGVIDRIDMLFNVAADNAKRMSLVVAAGAVDVVKAALGDNSGMVGAAMLGVDD